MSYQLQTAAIAAELRRAGISPESAARIAKLLGNSAQQFLNGPSSVDLTPAALRRVTPDVRKYYLTNADFFEGDPDYRRPSTSPSENKARPQPAGTVQRDISPQAASDPYRVQQGPFTQVSSSGDTVSVGLRVRNTGQFVSQDSRTGTLVGRNFRALSSTGDQGRVRLSIEEAGSDVIFKLEVDQEEIVADSGAAEPDPGPGPECASDEDCPEGEICVNGVCTPPCEPLSCGSSSDCGPNANGGDCVCIDGTCAEPECASDEDCPEGEICVDGVCVPDEGGGGGGDGGGGPTSPCASPACGSSGDCGLGCVCVSGVCIPAEAAFYCCFTSIPAEGEDLPETMCQLGRCFDGNGNPATDLTAAGPFATYEECCESGCGCRYECQSGGCIPSQTGQYEAALQCLQLCPDGGAAGSCCETLLPNTTLNETDCLIRRTAGPPGGVFRSGCQAEQYDADGELVITRTWSSDIPACPSTSEGACCKPDGTCEVLCQGECEAIEGAVYKGASWIDCETPRDSEIGSFYDYPCGDCNGLGDCGCESDERCVDKGNTPAGAKCESCGEEAEVVTDAFQFKFQAVSAGDTVKVYVRSCDENGEPLADRTAEFQIGDAAAGNQVFSVDTEDEFVADADGNMRVRLTQAGASAVVCVTVEEANPPPPPPEPPPEVLCSRCAWTVSADFTAPPSCPDGWTLNLGDTDGDGIVDAPSDCVKYLELALGAETDIECPGGPEMFDQINNGQTPTAIQEIVDHVNGSPDAVVPITAEDVAAAAFAGLAPHFQCPDGKCYEGVFAVEDCPEGNPLP